MIFLKKLLNKKNFANNCCNFATIVILLFSFVCKTNAEEFNMNNMPPPEIYMEYSLGTLSEESIVTIDIIIPDNWHVNANIAADEFLKPSSIEINAKGIEFGEAIWPEPFKEYSEALDFENFVFKGHFQIKIPIKKALNDCDSLTTKAIFNYQACDNSICLAPSKVEFTLDNSNTIDKKNTFKKKGTNEVLKKIDPNDSNKQINLNSTESINQNTSASTWILLLFAFLGGIILNLMPCVLPVLSLKLFTLIKESQESKKRLFILGFVTTLGILVSFWILALIVVIVKTGGGIAGWGMQFQNAGFIAFMTIILTLFAMSFFGVFEVWLPWNATTKMNKAGNKSGILGAFFTGALLVLLSTPCSAPFLGTAMGFAFTASTPILFLFFSAAGLGLSLPYLLVSLCPTILKIFPKPGPWMITLQKIMGILLFASVAWLLWIVHEQSGKSGLIIFSIIVIISISLSFFIGKFAPVGSEFKREIIALGISAIVLIICWFGFISPKYNFIVIKQFKERMISETLENGWYRYSEKLFHEFKNMNKTIFIDITADWCLTCKANEAAILNKKDFIQAMDNKNIIRMKADWTRESPEVNTLLKNLGKSGVPAYAIFPHGDINQKIILPEILTTNLILENIP